HTRTPPPISSRLPTDPRPSPPSSHRVACFAANAVTRPSWTRSIGRRLEGDAAGGRPRNHRGKQPLQALVELDLGLPAEHLAGARDVGLAHLRVVDGEGLEDDLGLRARDADDRLGEL